MQKASTMASQARRPVSTCAVVGGCIFLKKQTCLGKPFRFSMHGQLA